jgi:hypothetical protein
MNELGAQMGRRERQVDGGAGTELEAEEEEGPGCS